MYTVSKTYLVEITVFRLPFVSVSCFISDVKSSSIIKAKSFIHNIFFSGMYLLDQVLLSLIQLHSGRMNAQFLRVNVKDQSDRSLI